MRKKNFLNKVLQNTSCPQGFWGRMILRGMNCFHASLANRGMKQVEWQPNWNVLDIGCGGGANLKRLLNLCPKGNIYGIDLSEESVSFAQKYNEKDLNKRCFIQQGNVCSLPYDPFKRQSLPSSGTDVKLTLWIRPATMLTLHLCHWKEVTAA